MSAGATGSRRHPPARFGASPAHPTRSWSERRTAHRRLRATPTTARLAFLDLPAMPPQPSRDAHPAVQRATRARTPEWARKFDQTISVRRTLDLDVSAVSPLRRMRGSGGHRARFRGSGLASAHL